MTQTELEHDLTRIFHEVLKRDVPSPSTDLLESGLLDSLALVELLSELEQRFDVTFDLDELELDTFRTVETISDFVAAQRRRGT